LTAAGAASTMAGMPRHDVTLQLEQRIPVQNVDAVFEVREDGELLGKLKISKGTIDWMPAHAKITRKRRWRTFAAWMES
jgi:hypothetical protein